MAGQDGEVLVGEIVCEGYQPPLISLKEIQSVLYEYRKNLFPLPPDVIFCRPGAAQRAVFRTRDDLGLEEPRYIEAGPAASLYGLQVRERSWVPYDGFVIVSTELADLFDKTLGAK